MNTRAIAEEYRLAHWAQVMQERQEKGLDIKTYCKITGIHQNTYYYWQRKLREAACNELNKTQSNTTSLQPTGFTEIRLAESETIPSSIDVRQGQIQVNVVDISVTADCGYPIEMLAALIQRLRMSC
jgi:transposase-like protein